MPLIYHSEGRVVYEWHFVAFQYNVKAHKHRGSGIVVLFIKKIKRSTVDDIEKCLV